ncbi:hypothetical protein GYB59_18510 [bacterium]|nr:hypothetical protein [bacterium]
MVVKSIRNRSVKRKYLIVALFVFAAVFLLMCMFSSPYLLYPTQYIVFISNSRGDGLERSASGSKLSGGITQSNELQEDNRLTQREWFEDGYFFMLELHRQNGRVDLRLPSYYEYVYGIPKWYFYEIPSDKIGRHRPALAREAVAIDRFSYMHELLLVVVTGGQLVYVYPLPPDSKKHRFTSSPRGGPLDNLEFNSLSEFVPVEEYRYHEQVMKYVEVFGL